MKSSKKQGLIISYIYFVLNTIISIFLSAYIIRSVGQTDYGVYQTVASFVSYLILLEFGTGTIMIRNISIARNENDSNSDCINKHFSTIWSLTLLLSIGIMIVSAVFFFLIPVIYSNSLNKTQIDYGRIIFVLVAINLLFTFLTNTLNGLIIGFEYYSFEKIIAIIKLLIRSGLVIIILIFIKYSLIITIIDAILSIIVFVITYIFARKRTRAKYNFKMFDKTIFRSIIPIAIGLFIQTVVNTMNSNVGKFLIGIILTPEEVAVYSIAMSLFLMFSSIGSIPVLLFMPQISKIMQEKPDGKTLTQKLVPACQINSIILGLILVGFIAFGEPFVELVYGVEYKDAWILAIILMIPTYFNLFNAVVVNVVDLKNKRLQRSLVLVFITILNLILTIFALRIFGMIGAALCTALSTIIQIIILNIYYKKVFGINSVYLFAKSSEVMFAPLFAAGVIAHRAIYFIETSYLGVFAVGCLFLFTFSFLFVMMDKNNLLKNLLNLKRLKKERQ